MSDGGMVSRLEGTDDISVIIQLNNTGRPLVSPRKAKPHVCSSRSLVSSTCMAISLSCPRQIFVVTSLRFSRHDAVLPWRCIQKRFSIASVCQLLGAFSQDLKKMLHLISPCLQQKLVCRIVYHDTRCCPGSNSS